MPTAVVTGASSGIGLELARLLARDRHDVTLVARRGDRLAEIVAELSENHGVRAVPVALDLSDPDAPAELVRRLDSEVDVLVNNAGVGRVGRFAECGWDEWARMLQLNLVTLTELTHRLCPGMVERRYGRILNVGSTAGFQPGPGMAVYYATKAYVLSLSEALAVELAGTGVTVTTLAPGVTDTPFIESSDAQDVLLTRFMRMPARQVAEAGYRGMLAGRSLVVPGLVNKLGAQAVRVGPRWLVPRVIAKLHGI